MIEYTYTCYSLEWITSSIQYYMLYIAGGLWMGSSIQDYMLYIAGGLWMGGDRVTYNLSKQQLHYIGGHVKVNIN